MCVICQQIVCEMSPLQASTTEGSVTYGSSIPDSDISAALAALVTPYVWTSNSVTYSFPASSSEIDPNATAYDEELSLHELSSYGQAMVSTAIAQWGAISGLTFTEVTTGGDITIAGTDATTTAWAYLPNSGAGGSGGDVWVGTSRSYNALFTTTTQQAYLGSYEYLVSMHELGHALGLKHPHTAMSGVNTNVMSTTYDALEYSVMSYRSYVGANTGGYTVYSGSYPQSLMMLDIAAIQQMYGADYTTYAGDTVYTFSPTTGTMYVNGISTGSTVTNTVFRTLWDGNGTDLIDLSAYTTNMSVDLGAGGKIIFDVDGTTQRARMAAAYYATANVYMSLLYDGNTQSLIENVTTGSGDDDIVGNEADNLVDAGLGTNTVDGLEGTDTVVLHADSTDAVTVRLSDGELTFYYASGASATLTNVEYVQVGSEFYSVAEVMDTLVASGSSALHVLSDVVSGAVANGEASDVLSVDLFVSSGYTAVYGTTGVDTLKDYTTSAVLVGDAGNDRFFLRNGDDVAFGGDGADRFIFDLRSTSDTGVDLVADLDFAEGDWLSILTSVSGIFSDDPTITSTLFVSSDGASVSIYSFADLAEFVTTKGVTIEDGSYGLVVTIQGVTADLSIELAGYSVSQFADYTLTSEYGVTNDADPTEEPTTTDVAAIQSSYISQGYSLKAGTTSAETVVMKSDMTLYTGDDGADRFNWDMRAVTDTISEVILDLDFSEGDWLSILTKTSGAFDDQALSDAGIWTGSTGEQLYLTSLSDLQLAISTGVLEAVDGEYGVVLSVSDAAGVSDRTLELVNIWLDDLQVA